MWIYFVKDFSIKTTSGELKVYSEGANINCRDEEKALDLIKRGYCVESDKTPVVLD
jgi:hypothetical protein